MDTDAQVLFRRRAEELLHAIEDQLRSEEVAGVREMVEEGDYAGGIRTLAWIVEGKKSLVPVSIRLRICELSRSVVDVRDMPEGFRSLLIDGKRPNQPPQRNAGSRPSSDDSSAFETPSSRGPRG